MNLKNICLSFFLALSFSVVHAAVLDLNKTTASENSIIRASGKNLSNFSACLNLVDQDTQVASCTDLEVKINKKKTRADIRMPFVSKDTKATLVLSSGRRSQVQNFFVLVLDDLRSGIAPQSSDVVIPNNLGDGLLTITQGSQGDTGATGPQGPAGPQGPQGPRGPEGPVDTSAIDAAIAAVDAKADANAAELANKLTSSSLLPVAPTIQINVSTAPGNAFAPPVTGFNFMTLRNIAPTPMIIKGFSDGQVGQRIVVYIKGAFVGASFRERDNFPSGGLHHSTANLSVPGPAENDVLDIPVGGIVEFIYASDNRWHYLSHSHNSTLISNPNAAP